MATPRVSSVSGRGGGNHHLFW